MIVLIAGPQGSGKGTVASRIKQEYGWAHVSTGDLIRDEIKTGSAFGRDLASLINAGKLVDDDTMLAMLQRRLGLPDARKGVILDGYPRNVEQARALNARFTVGCVLKLEAPEGVLIARIGGRQNCPACGRIYGVDFPPKTPGVCDDDGGRLFVRDDDKPDAVRKRLQTYYEKTEPIFKLYAGKVRVIDSSKRIDAIMVDVRKALVGCRQTGG